MKGLNEECLYYDISKEKIFKILYLFLFHLLLTLVK